MIWIARSANVISFCPYYHNFIINWINWKCKSRHVQRNWVNNLFPPMLQLPYIHTFPIQPYLSTMNEKLMHDEVLLEKQSYRDKLSTDLKMVKSELDRVREKFRISQARSSADIERLTKLSQVCQCKKYWTLPISSSLFSTCWNRLRQILSNELWYLFCSEMYRGGDKSCKKCQLIMNHCHCSSMLVSLYWQFI